MARIRSVHPKLWTDEDFVSLSMASRLFLIGLWGEADDHGMFEWKPIGLKMRLSPADAIDPVTILSELEAARFIIRIERLGRQIGVVRNFRKYQRPKNPSAPMVPVDAEIAGIICLKITSPTPALPQPYPSPTENPVQMEDGGDKMEEYEPSSLRSDVGRKAPKARLDCSDELVLLGCSESLIADWKAVRKAKRAGPISQTVVESLKREAMKAGVSVCQAVTICVERSWQGFDADWIAKPGARAGPSHAPPRRGSAGMFDALQEIRREMENGARPDDFGQFGSPVLRISSE